MWHRIPVSRQQWGGLYTASFLVIYSLFLKLFWESVNTEPEGLEHHTWDASIQGSIQHWVLWDLQRLVAGLEEQIQRQQQRQTQPFASLPPIHCPCKAAGNSWKALGGGEGKAGPSSGKRKELELRHGRGWDICRARMGIDSSLWSSPCCGFPMDGCQPSIPLGWWFRLFFTSPCFSVSFLGAFPNSQEMLQGSAQMGNHSSGWGGSPLPEGRGFVGFAADFVVGFCSSFPSSFPSRV